MDNWIYGMFDGWIGFNIYFLCSFSSLLDESAVILDLTETSLERIIHTILNKMLDNLNAPLAYEEAMSTLFLPESGNILAKTIQVVSCQFSLDHFKIQIYVQSREQSNFQKQSRNPNIITHTPIYFSMRMKIIIKLDRVQLGSTGRSWRTTSPG